MLGFDWSLPRLAQKAAIAFAPGQLTSLALWHDPSDPSTLFQDVAMNVPVSADGQAVAAMADKSGNGHHAIQTTASARPLFRSVAGANWLEFDGTDDWLKVTSLDLSATSALTLALAMRRDATSGVHIPMEFSAATDFNTNPGSFAVIAPHSGLAAPNAVVMAGTSDNGIVKIGASMAAASYVLSARFDRSQAGSLAAIDLRTDGGGTPVVVVDSTGFSGNFGSYPLYIGRRGGTSYPFAGRLYGTAIVARGLDDAELSRLETWMQRKIA